MDSYQFYPTPPSLARKLCALFETTPTRLLEPSAGAGDLVRAARERFPNLGKNDIDLYEIDPSRHGHLADCGHLVGLDFLESLDLSIYSHVLMNPPFRQGVQHVLHAWTKLFSGEIAAVLNASGVREPATRDEERLAKLIAEHGRVEYASEAFLSPDTLRKTDVEVALVHLRKQKSAEFWSGSILDALGVDDLAEDQTQFAEREPPSPQGMVLSQGQIPAMVRAYRAAWEATKESIIAQHRAARYTSFFEDQVSRILNQDVRSFMKKEIGPLHRDLQSAYAKIRNSAWMAVLNTSDFRKYLTRKAQSEVLADFEQVSRMEFSEPNIYGFLQGFALRQDEINAQMVCDLFDQIVYANSENCLFYRWKSNAKHQIGMALQRKRFILSGFSLEGWRSTIGYDAQQKLQEIDRITALVTGQREIQDTLAGLFSTHLSELRYGKRLGNRYFDVRWYPGIGTVHFFPKDQKLIDRINAIVGKHRRWMPEHFAAEADDKAIDKAYKAAELVSKAILEKVDPWTLPQILSSRHSESDKREAVQKLQSAFDEAVAYGGEENFWTQIARIEARPRPATKPAKASTPEERQRALALALA
ncbi:DUF4942 domain-containing protein [Acidithiobacillus caldus]|uniref:DUF4942 domain-containing protein n=1 Tax=Acidithiobacillus caldus TaxID=33059 RepID=A0A1E7YPM6_9PROT|nr:DUF4942 domain-containing protein [Acidithiobacillus caldus]OFC37632.1 hypothetical protein BAE29_10325 [Acidithiobacillus caldus]OFC37752.1 hypothetical protein BAE28_06755 [Acidithiobacillus caldus]OFC37872.1 hypothetical protein BAE27_03325 [Acidithiobacillus caldus]